MHYYHIIVDLDIGGAENMLLNFLKSIDNPQNHTVISLVEGGVLFPEFLGTDAQIYQLGVNKNPISIIVAIYNMDKIIKDNSTVVAWMYHGMLFANMIKWKKSIRLISNIRHSDVGLKNNKFATFLIIRVLALLSGGNDCIVYNGEQTKLNHNRIGFKSLEEITIGNGVDLSKFSAIYNDRVSHYASWKNRRINFLTISRYHKIKGIEILIKSLQILKEEFLFHNFKLNLVGKGLDESNKDLCSLIEQCNLENEITLCGCQQEVHKFYSEADLFILPSLSEAFPNVLIEAMASGVLCVSTGVGDVPLILEKDFFTEPSDMLGLATLIHQKLLMQQSEVNSIIERNRNVIVENYDIKRILSQYKEIIEVK